MNVRRLAAIDMWGVQGTRRRRRIILAEFLFGAVAGVAFGAWVLNVQRGLGGLLFGLWLVGIGLNYVPLTLYAVRLSRSGALEAELDGVDAYRELWRYSVWQFWCVVPMSLIVFTVRDEVTKRPER